MVAPAGSVVSVPEKNSTDETVTGRFFFFALAAGALIAWVILWPVTSESVQFFSSVFIPVTAILTGWIFLFLRTVIPGSFHFILYTLTALLAGTKLAYHSCTGKVARADVAAVIKFKNQYGWGLFASLRDSSEFKTSFHFNTQVYPPLTWIAGLWRGYQNYTLNTTMLNIDTTHLYGKMLRRTVAGSPYYQFAIKYPSRNHADIQKDFIRAYAVSYLAVSPATVAGPAFSGILRDSIILSDAWKIYKLANN